MTTYTKLHPDEENAAPRRHHHGLRGTLLKAAWVFQALLALLRIHFFLSALLGLFLMIEFMHPPVSELFWPTIVALLDLTLSTLIVLTVIRQFIYRSHTTCSCPLHAADTAKYGFRREAFKTACATYLWIWPLVGTSGGRAGGSKEDQQALQQISFGLGPAVVRVVKGMLTAMNVGVVLVTVMIIISFYPPLYLSWRAMRDEKNRGIEAPDAVELSEHRVGLLDRDSDETLEGEEEEGRKRGWGRG